MSKFQLLTSSICAGMLLPVLLASTPNYAQQVVRSPEPPKSIISLASAPGPQGEMLARHPGDATFAHPPANYHVFAAARMGEDAGVELLTANFDGETKLTRIDSKNKDFVIEPGGTCHAGNVYARGGSCTLLVRFNPQGPGHRLGFINVTHSAEAKPMSFGLTGNGAAPVVSFTPSQITTVPTSVSSGTGTISGSTNLAIDGGDILYIADTGNYQVKQVDSAGAIVPYPSAPIGGSPASIAVDSFGTIYTANVLYSAYYFSVFFPWGSQVALDYAYTPSLCTPSAPCGLSGVGMYHPANLSIDANDNLFFEEQNQGAAEMPVSIITGGSPVSALNLWHLSDRFAYAAAAPASFAVDANGNLYTGYSQPSFCYLLEESLYNAEYSPSASRVAGGTHCGFSGDGGQARGAEISSTIGQIAFDIAGNLYFADAGNQRVRRIDALTGIIRTIAGNGTAGYSGDNNAATAATLSNPTGLAVDSQGQVYILSYAPIAGPTQVVRKVGVLGYWSYGYQLKATASPAKVFTVANTGNDVLTLSANALWTGPNASDFSINPTTTSCVLTAGATLAAGHSCQIGIVFTPSAGGSRSADLHLMDNTVNGSNTIHLYGVGRLTPTMAITSPTAGSSVSAGTTVNFTVSVTYPSSPQPTGTVAFSVKGVSLGSAVTVNPSGIATKSFSEPTASTYTLTATYNGDSNYVPATVTETLIVTAIKLPVTVSLVPAINPLAACGAISFSVKVTSSAGAGPTGTVQLKSGASSLASATLLNGVANLAASRLAAGSHSFIATYSGDSLHQPATSTPISLTVPPVGASCSGSHPPAVAVARQPVVR
jgi:large repetitive protein